MLGGGGLEIELLRGGGAGAGGADTKGSDGDIGESGAWPNLFTSSISAKLVS